jgi:hypothetical protein
MYLMSIFLLRRFFIQIHAFGLFVMTGLVFPQAAFTEQAVAPSTHLTPHFAIIHEQPADWAHALGTNLESLREHFFSQVAWLGAQPSSLSVSSRRLQWDCMDRIDRLDADSTETRFSASYVTRTHSVQLFWSVPGSGGHDIAPRLENAYQPVYHGTSGAEEALHSKYLFLRISHEVAHQLSFDSGLQKRGVMYPLWVSEGLAMAFESPRPEDVHFLGPNPSRQQRLKDLCARKKMQPLSDFVTRVDTRGLNPSETEDFYAQAWALFRFMGQQRGHVLKRYLEVLAHWPMGSRSPQSLREEMISFFGPLDRLETAWQDWVESEIAAAR